MARNPETAYIDVIQSRRRETLRVLDTLHNQLRSCLIKDDCVCGRTRNALNQYFAPSEGSANQFAEWLDRHCALCYQTETISRPFRHWLSEHGLPILPSKQKRLKTLKQWCGDLARKSDRRSLGKNDQRKLENILATALGLVFIRHNVAIRQWYYHWLLSDLIPNKTRSDVMEALAVPHGLGTIGWVAKRAKTHATSYSSFRKTPKPVVIWSCFADPRGSVATEDLVIGNRSWVGIPIFDVDRAEPSDPLGILFTYLPFDGILYDCAEGAAPFVHDFQSEVTRISKELILALALDDAQILNELRAIAPEQNGLHRVSKKQSPEMRTAQDDDFGIVPALISAHLAPDDPLGLLAMVTASDSKGGPKCTFSLREHAFINRLFELLQIACSYPSKWAPSTARVVDAFIKSIKSPRSHNSSKMPLPIWIRPQSINNLLQHTASLYPRSYAAQITPVVRRFQKQMVSTRRARDRLSRMLETGLRLHSEPSTGADLLIPVFDKRQRSVKAVVRVKVLDNSNDESFQRLYRFFRSSVVKKCLSNLATVLETVDEESKAATKRIDRLKTLIDVRRVVCESTVNGFMEALTSDHPKSMAEIKRYLLVEAALLVGAPKSRLETDVNALGESLQIVSEAGWHKKELPNVELVAIWSSRERYVICSHSLKDLPSLDRIFLHDRGILQLLTLTVEHDSSWSDRYQLEDYAHRRDVNGNVIVDPPGFWPSADQYVTIEHGRERSGKPQSVLRVSRLPAIRERQSPTTGTITWEASRFPEPLAMAFVPSRVQANVFRNVQPIESFLLTEQARELRTGVPKELNLEQVFQVFTGKECPNVRGFLNELVWFMSDDGVNDGPRDLEWMVTRSQRGLMLLHASKTENTDVKQLREEAMQRAAAQWGDEVGFFLKLPPEYKESFQKALVERIVYSAGFVCRWFKDHDVGIDGEIEFYNQWGGRVCFNVQLKAGDSHLRYVKNNNTWVFDVKNAKHLNLWTESDRPVFLIIYTPEGNRLEWMNVTKCLKSRSDKLSKQIVFQGEPFTVERLQARIGKHLQRRTK